MLRETADNVGSSPSRPGFDSVPELHCIPIGLLRWAIAPGLTRCSVLPNCIVFQ